MEILPIHLISEEDQAIFGANLYNLAKLKRLNFPVADGIAAAAPTLHFKTLLEHFDFGDKEIFEQSLDLIKKEIVKIPIDEDLKKALAGRKSFYLNGAIFKNKNELWLKLLEIWLNQIRSKIWREGFVKNLTGELDAQAILFLDHKYLPLTAHFDPHLKDSVIEGAIKLTPKQLLQIDQTVAAANKRLFLPQIYHFVAGEKIQLVAVTAYTQPLSKNLDNIIAPEQPKSKIRSAVKVFATFNKVALVDGIDGIIFPTSYNEEFDDLVLRLIDVSQTFKMLPVIVKLPDEKEAEVRGSLRLIHSQALLDLIAAVFLFVRNKKNHLNLSLAIPYVRSSQEFLQIKRELAVRNLTRKGSLKLYLEVAVPENIINIENYLSAGFDGIILNLDELSQGLGGYKAAEGQFYKGELNTMIKFLKELPKKLHQVKIPMIAQGQVSFHPDVLDFLVENGIFGVVANNLIEAESLPEHLNWAEKRMIIKRISQV